MKTKKFNYTEWTTDDEKENRFTYAFFMSLIVAFEVTPNTE